MKKIKVLFVSFLMVVGFLMITSLAYAGASTIGEAGGPPSEVLPNPEVFANAGAVVPTTTFSLGQISGSATLNSVTVVIVDPSSSGLLNTDIASVSLRKESGTNPGGFQAGEDLLVTGASVNTPAINTPITLTPTTPEAIGSSPVKYYIVITIAASPANGHSLAVNLGAGYGIASDGPGNTVGSALNATKKITIDNAPTISSATAYTDRIIINFSENVDGIAVMNCSNYTVGGVALTCGGMGLPFVDFQGNKATIRGLPPLSGTTVLTIAGSVINDTDGPQNALAAYNSGTLTVNALVLPAITSIANNVGGASSGAVGNTLTITGTNFGTDPGGSHTNSSHKVFFSGGFDPMTGPTPPIEATSFTSWSATSIVVAVPTGAQSGPVNVMVDGVMSDMNQNSFFDIAASYTFKIYYGGTPDSPTSAMADGDAGNIRVVVGGMGGQVVHYVGDGTTTYSNDTDTFTITGVSSMGWTWAYDITGAHLNSQGQQVDTSTTKNLILATTSRKISGTITLGSSCADTGKNQNVVIFAMPDQVDTGGTNFKPTDPAFFKTNGSCTASYSVGIPMNGVYRVEAHIPPEANATSVSSTFTDPVSLPVTISDSALTPTGNNFTFTSATHRIVGTVVKPSGSFGTDERGMLYVFAYQPRENGKGTGTQVDANGHFTLYVTKGTWKVGVGGGNMNFPVEVQVDVDDSYLIAENPKGPTIVIAPPSDYIEGYVKDSAGNGLANSSIYAWLEGAPGGGNAQTDSQGYYKMYVTPGSNYHVGANSQAYGFLGEQSPIAVSGSTHPTVNFTVSSSNYIVSGTVQKGGVALQQAFVFITNGEYGQMLGSDGTSATGAFSVRVSGGSGLYLHVGLPGKGEIYSTSLSSINADTALATINITTSTITVRISPASSFTQAFVGVHSDTSGGFSDTDVATGSPGYREYQIDVKRPASGTTTYYIDGGIPGYGPLPQISVGVDSFGNFTESLTNQSGGSATDGTILITLGGLYTVSGTVTGTNVKDAWVFASGPSGGGGGAVAANGTYSFQLRDGTYDIGVGKPGYIGNKITSIVNGADLPTQDLILTTASDTITGTVYLPDGTTPAVNAQVWAENGNGGMGGGSTDASGNYSLSVSSGSWTVKAAYDGYNSNGISVTAPATGKNITLVTVAGFAPNTKNSPITPSDGGIMSGSGFKIDFPKNALGTSSSAGTVEVKSTTNVVQKNDRQLIGTAKEFTVRNSDNQNVTTLSGSATIELTVSRAELVTSGLAFSKIKDIKITYYDSTGGSWIEIPTVVTLSVPTASTIAELDADPAITLTGTTTHLSTYSPSLPTDSDAPATPTGLSATAGNASASLSWTASSGATKYDIYKKVGDDYPYLAQTTSTSYSASGLTNGTVYYFKVSALDGSDRESAATSSVSVTPVAPSSNTSGGGGYITTYALPPVVTSPITPTSAKVYNFGTTILKNGSKGEGVKELQRFLNDKLKLGLIVDGALGPKTITVIKQWQKDNGLVADGLIGAKTKAIMNASDVASSPAVSASATTNSYNLGTAILKNGSRGEAVKELQRFLNDKLKLGLIVDGALGPKTITVIKQWQKDNGLVADGLIGAKTKAIMNASVQ